MAFTGNANTILTLDGLFKNTYADKIENLIPQNNKLQQMIKFIAKDKSPGLLYNQPVVLGLEHGITYANEDDGAFELNESIAGTMRNAQIRGFQMVLRSAISYSAASRSLTSQAAFQDSTKFLVGNMLDSMRKKVEVELMYGQSGIGEVEAPVTITTAGVDCLIKDAQWSPGIWGGAEKMKIEAYTAGVINGSVMEVVSVSFENKSVKLKTATGSVNLLADDVIYPSGAFGKQMAGLHKILSNTGSLFGIDAASYTLWKGNVFTPGTLGTPVVLTFAILQQAIAKAVEKGLDKDVVCMVNPGHWDDLLTEQASLRQYDSSYSSDKSENGSKQIKFHSQNGLVEVTPSIFVKEGFAYIICPEDLVRVGSTDVTFKRPGQGDNFFRDLESAAGYELRSYTDQALFCIKPGRQVIIQNLKVS